MFSSRLTGVKVPNLRGDGFGRLVMDGATIARVIVANSPPVHVPLNGVIPAVHQ
jgi:hypothetical protein